MALILPFRNSYFTYPGTAPGFNQSHPASQYLAPNQGYSVVASAAGSMVDIFNGNGSISVATLPTTVINPSIGVAARFGINTSGELDLPHQSWQTGNATTLAAICVWQNVSTIQFFLNIWSNHGKVLLSGGVLGFSDGVIGGGSGFSPVVGVPYFWCFSTSYGNTTNFISVNLTNGQVYTQVSAGRTFSAGNQASIGNAIGNTVGAGADIAAIMASPTFLTMPQLQQWAQNPWSFWYPPNTDLIQMIAKAATQSTPWAPWMMDDIATINAINRAVGY